MNRKFFKKVCLFSKNLLNEFHENIYIQSINELHVIRPHPSFLKKYSVINEKFFYTKIIFIFLKNFFSLNYHLINSFLTKKNYLDNLKKTKYLFFSHLLDENQFRNKIEKDVYFSHIVKLLKKKTINICYINHTKKNFKNSQNKIFLNKSIGFSNEIKLLFSLFHNSFTLLIRSFYEKNTVKKKIILLNFANCISNQTAENFRIYYQAFRILKITKPKKIVTTFEGHAFERNIFKAAYEYNTKCIKLAFHHSLPFKDQFAYLNFLKNKSNPDLILASGKFSFRKFNNDIKFKKKTFLVGSNRISKKKIFSNKNFKKNICLVIPEGIHDEAVFMLNFCLDYLHNFKNLKFIIRLHPALRNKINIYKNIFNNNFENRVSFSENKEPYDDFQRSQYCLYRGSSLVFDAIKNGLVPYYLSKKNEISFDPMRFEGKKKIKNEIYTSKSLFLKISKIKKFKPKDLNDAYSLPNRKIIKKLFN